MKILNDFNTTVEKALTEIDPKWKYYHGLIVCGTHTPENPELQIELIKEAREKGTPFLGICFGHQLAAIEYARNVLGIEDATSEEFHKIDGMGTYVVYKLSELNVGIDTVNEGDESRLESFWNNYEVRKDILDQWDKPENFITCQYHPEYQSSFDKPHPLLVKFIDLCKKKK